MRMNSEMSTSIQSRSGGVDELWGPTIDKRVDDEHQQCFSYSGGHDTGAAHHRQCLCGGLEGGDGRRRRPDWRRCTQRRRRCGAERPPRSHRRQGLTRSAGVGGAPAKGGANTSLQCRPAAQPVSRREGCGCRPPAGRAGQRRTAPLPARWPRGHALLNRRFVVVRTASADDCCSCSDRCGSHHTSGEIQIVTEEASAFGTRDAGVRAAEPLCMYAAQRSCIPSHPPLSARDVRDAFGPLPTARGSYRRSRRSSFWPSGQPGADESSGDDRSVVALTKDPPPQ